jgi:hypothetical protein
MNRGLGLCVGVGLLLAGSVAFAQATAMSTDVTIGYGGLPHKASGESNTGIQISDSLLLHAGIGAEAGYDTNVYYDPTRPVGSSIFRVMPFAELTNASRNSAATTALVFDARAALQYRHYGNSTIQSSYADAWNPNAGVSLSLGGAQFAFGAADAFSRIEDPPYATNGATQAGAIQRTNNQASVEGRWAPGGGRLTATLRYTNMVDVFDGLYSYADAVTHTLMLDASWKWLPKTAVFLNVQQSYIDYYNANSSKSDAFPLVATVGLRGLLTEKTSALIAVGYSNAFYQSGGSTQGFRGGTYANAAVTILPTQLSRIVLGARHDFVNAIISNFAYQDTAYASYVQQIAGRLALDLSGRYAHLSYGGTFIDPSQSGRVDNYFQIGGTLDYFLRNWAYLGVGYSFLDNLSSVKAVDMATGEVISANSYVKQQIFARIGVTY